MARKVPARLARANVQASLVYLKSACKFLRMLPNNKVCRLDPKYEALISTVRKTFKGINSNRKELAAAFAIFTDWESRKHEYYRRKALRRANKGKSRAKPKLKSFDADWIR